MTWQQLFTLNSSVHVSCSRNALLMFVQVGNSMEQDASRTGNGFSISEKIPRILWNPKTPYSVHTNPLLHRLSYETVPLHSILLLQYPFFNPISVT
jgi:hypothetical protein